MTEVVVIIELRFPTIDRDAVARQVEPVIAAAVKAGGNMTNITIEPFEGGAGPRGDE
jgi:hypothetical protein